MCTAPTTGLASVVQYYPSEFVLPSWLQRENGTLLHPDLTPTPAEELIEDLNAQVATQALATQEPKRIPNPDEEAPKKRKRAAPKKKTKASPPTKTARKTVPVAELLNLLNGTKPRANNKKKNG